MNDREAIKYMSNEVSALDTEIKKGADYLQQTHDCMKIALEALQEREERAKGCKYCNPHNNHLRYIQDCTTLYKNIGKDKNAPYIKAELLTGGCSKQIIRIESAIGNKVNRGAFDVEFCPMCGRKLEEGLNE